MNVVEAENGNRGGEEIEVESFVIVDPYCHLGKYSECITSLVKQYL